MGQIISFKNISKEDLSLKLGDFLKKSNILSSKEKLSQFQVPNLQGKEYVLINSSLCGFIIGKLCQSKDEFLIFEYGIKFDYNSYIEAFVYNNYYLTYHDKIYILDETSYNQLYNMIDKLYIQFKEHWSELSCIYNNKVNSNENRIKYQTYIQPNINSYLNINVDTIKNEDKEKSVQEYINKINKQYNDDLAIYKQAKKEYKKLVGCCVLTENKICKINYFLEKQIILGGDNLSYKDNCFSLTENFIISTNNDFYIVDETLWLKSKELVLQLNELVLKLSYDF